MKSVIRSIYNKCKKEVLFEFLSCSILRIILLIIPIIYSNIINYASSSLFKKSINMILVYIVIITLYKLVEYIRTYTFYHLYNKLYLEYSENAIKSTFNNSLFSLSRFSSGEYMNILHSDIDIISSFFTNSIYRFVQILEFIFIYYYFYKISPIFCLIAIISSVLIFFCLILFGNRLENLNIIRKKTLDKRCEVINDVFLGIKEIKGFNVSNYVNDKTKGYSKEYVDANSLYNIEYNVGNVISIYVFEILRLFMMIYGIYLITLGKIEIGVLMIIYSYYQKIIDNFTLVSTINVEYRSLKVSIERYNKIVEYARCNNLDGVIVDNVLSKIEFKNILYGYKKDPTLYKFNMVIKCNSINSIIGFSDREKISIYELLIKYNRQHSGNIFIDGIDINDINDVSYFNLVSYVRSNPKFFDISIMDNLLLASGNVDNVISVCKSLNIDDNIRNLSNGYDTIDIMNNEFISSDLIKMLAIARVILKNTNIMLFDDVIDSLDNSNRKCVLNVLNELRCNHTIIIITRNKDILKLSDMVYVLDNKRVVVSGTHKELIKSSDIYKSIINK